MATISRQTLCARVRRALYRLRSVVDWRRSPPGAHSRVNVLDFDMVPSSNGPPSLEIARVLVKAVNLTPYNYLKHGMNLTSLEAIFARDEP